MILIGSQQQLLDEMVCMAEWAAQKHGQIGYVVWDDIRTSPEGIHYIASPVADPRFEGYVPVCAQIVMPEAWLICSDCNPEPEEAPQAYNP